MPTKTLLGACRRQLIKEHAGEAGPAWLYFGCRNADEDFLYGDEFQAFVKDGTLDRLETAFSRAGPEKVYVQHHMLEQVSAAAEWMIWLVGNRHVMLTNKDRTASHMSNLLFNGCEAIIVPLAIACCKP